jgi:5-methylcytosine-specific restriction protein B
MSAITSKVRLFDLAKELKIDTKRLIEEARREGVDVSVPSNSISKELAEKIREKYYPKKEPSFMQVRVLRPTAAAPSAGIRPSETVSASPTTEGITSSTPADERVIQVNSRTLEDYWNRQRLDTSKATEELAAAPPPEIEPEAPVEVAPAPELLPPARVVRKLAPTVRAVRPAPEMTVTPPVEASAPTTAAPAEHVPPTPRQIRVLRPSAAALNAGVRPGERAPEPRPSVANPIDTTASRSSTEAPIEVDSQPLEDHWNQIRSKKIVRLYDLAKALKIDTKRLIEDVRREGVDVSVPSNSISHELAERIRDKYFPKKDTAVKRAVKIVKKAGRLVEDVEMDEALNPPTRESEGELLPLEVDARDEVVQTVRDLIPDYAGVILTGPPGTSKTWYARQIAAALTDRDKGRVRFVQFHQSYQYEDFVEGYVPKEDGNGFQLRPKHLMEMCEVARHHDGKLCVMIVDELSRSDPGRVFGEALTYIEPTLREIEFYLASGNPAKIPRNLFFLATMNPLDRGVAEVDAALDRRFAKIAMDPSPERLLTLLNQNGVRESLKNSILGFFRFLLRNRNERCRVGHAYFRAIRTEADLQRLWDHQLRFHMEKAFQVDRESFRIVEEEWKRTFPAPPEPRW